MKRKILSLILSVLTAGAIFLMAGCGGSGSSTGGSGGSAPAGNATGGSVNGSAN